MTAGLPGDGSGEPDWWSAPDWVGAILAAGTVAEPGPRFAYSSSSAHLLAAVLVEATGRSVLDYARQVLFDPLGIDTRPATTVVVTDDPGSARYDAAPGFVWPQDPQAPLLRAGHTLLEPHPPQAAPSPRRPCESHTPKSGQPQ